MKNLCYKVTSISTIPKALSSFHKLFQCLELKDCNHPAPFVISQPTFTCFLQQLVQLFHRSCQLVALCLRVISSTLSKSSLFHPLVPSSSNCIFIRKLKVTKKYEGAAFSKM